ncbi:MAG TPA: histidine kinase [Candidatus Bathyarchaeia archaeon]|nr:histidine kinase [Candidatus Bathyarchaeia archaeon]
MARVFLAAISLLAVHLDSTEPAAYAKLTRNFLLAYLVYSLVVMLWLRTSWQLRHSSIPLLLHGIDILGPAIIVLFSDGPNSPFLMFLVFALVAAGYRWGKRETLATTVVALLVVTSEAALVRYGSTRLGLLFQGAYDTNRLVIRIAYLLAMGFLIGHLAQNEKRLQEESISIARLLAQVRPEQGIKQTLQAVLGHLLHVFGADAVLLAVEEVRWRRLYIWEGRPTEQRELKLHLFEANSSQEPVYCFPLAGEFVYAQRQHNRIGQRLVSALALDADGNPVNGATSVFPDHPLWRDVETAIAGSFTIGEEWSGRLFLINPTKPSVSRLAVLRFLRTVIGQLTPAVSGAYVLRRLRSKAGAIERVRVARELHDGPIQSLVALEMRIYSLRRRSEHNLKDMSTELLKIQETLRQEITSLRELMVQIRPLNLDPRQFVDFLADLVERFRRETGLCANFVTELDEVRLPAHTLRELGRIVQEALVNARKHSGARHVLVSLSYKDGLFRIVIDDDGCGFGFAGRFSLQQLEAERKGPMVIKERIRNIGGGLVIESAPGRGARLEVSLPFPKAQAIYA